MNFVETVSMIYFTAKNEAIESITKILKTIKNIRILLFFCLGSLRCANAELGTKPSLSTGSGVVNIGISFGLI